MKIYVVGTGGVGGYFGGLFAKAGNDVTFVARGENYQAINENGLIVKSVTGDFEIKPAKVIEHITDITNPDLILFTVKTYQTEGAATELTTVVSPSTIIITFQNGVDNDEKIKQLISGTHIYPGIAYVISTKTGPNVISQTGGLRKLVFGDRKDPANPDLQQVETLMKKAGIDAVLSDDINCDLWKKFLFIIPFAGLTAMHRQTIGEILSKPATTRAYEACLVEAIEVAKKNGVRLDDDIFDTVMATTKNTTPGAKSSLLIDIETGRPTEIETLHGTLLRLAKEKGIDVPVNEEIYLKVKGA